MSKRAYLIGWPVSHSLSPLMHETAYDVLGLAGWSYSSLAVKPANLGRTLGELLADEATIGVNVTIPHKEAILDLVPAAAGVVNQIGAANTLARRPEGGFGAHNTDVLGFAACLEAATSQPVGRALLLGAGGSARACAAALEAQGLCELGLVCRRLEQGHELLSDLARTDPGSRVGVAAGGAHLWGWSELDRALAWLTAPSPAGAAPGRSAIVNTTPLGMWPHPHASPLSQRQLAGLPDDCLVVDLVYRPRPTRLLRDAGARGLAAVDGLEMLVQQGFAALALWLGRDPGPEALLAMRQATQFALEEDAAQCSV